MAAAMRELSRRPLGIEPGVRTLVSRLSITGAPSFFCPAVDFARRR